MNKTINPTLADYLQCCLSDSPDDRLMTPYDDKLLSNIATNYLGNPDPTHNLILRKTLVYAVAKMIHSNDLNGPVCILKGPQGCGKTRFWQTLASLWYGNAPAPQHNFTWLLEVEPQHISTLINNPQTFAVVVSSCVDLPRKFSPQPPFYVIPVGCEAIPIAQLEKDCNRIWASAYHAFRAGETW